jgi:GT2 family glycosyltransferase
VKKISVVIPNLHSPLIDQTLDALHHQTIDLSQVEVLVVGLDGPGLVREDALVRFISTGTPATAAQARNIGIRQAQGEIICFTDADCVPAPDWLEKLLAPYTDPGISVVGGAMPLPAKGYWARCDALASAYEYLAFQPSGPRRQIPSLNLSARREALEDIGGFDEGFPHAAGEDDHLTVRMRRAGHTLWMATDALVEHIGWRRSARTVLGHTHLFGRNTIWLSPDMADFVRPPFFFRHWTLMLLVTPLLAAWITARMFLRQPALLRHLILAPGVYACEVAWCLGAVHTLYHDSHPMGSQREAQP